MRRWPFPVERYTAEEVAKYVADKNWQAFRLTMKGVETGRKLQMLSYYRHSRIMDGPQEEHRRYQVQVDNYINALKRGGQLTMDLRVKSKP